MLKPSLQLRISQQLTMTPQLQQAIRLLQLSTLELQTEIQQTLENNPMLESLEDDADVDDKTDGEMQSEPVSEKEEQPQAEEERPLTEQTETLKDELPVDTSWEDIYDSPGIYSGSAENNERNLFENQSGVGESLQDHLLSQVHLTNMSETDQVIAMAIIDAINEHGYLTEALESIHSNLSREIDIELDEVEAVLHLLQRLDPVGCGAQNLAECLSLQLQQLPEDTSDLTAAKILVRDHLDLLAARNFKQLIKRMKLNEVQLQQAIILIQTLNPRPGTLISNQAPEYIIPDVTVYKSQATWKVELNTETAPRLRINPFYAGMVKRADQSKDNTYLRDQLQEARWFLKSLQSRNETMLKVATAIVNHQRGFLDYGEEAMKPLVLKDIAEQLEMHESTISRVTTQKYMHTPKGIFEFKYFFSSHVGTVDGGVCSATAIRAMIKKLIADEDHKKPLSDNKISKILVSKGINVARRTVAKYREAISIPPSNERKRL
ncbi:MAG: RNA polymerase factor sigma-54 [Gammaproteobacteria bacterium]|nr:RNA polymerase factor sigma-54 [Gammaproteobacteria bacterium]